jgi:hypothetical protein
MPHRPHRYPLVVLLLLALAGCSANSPARPPGSPAAAATGGGAVSPGSAVSPGGASGTPLPGGSGGAPASTSSWCVKVAASPAIKDIVPATQALADPNGVADGVKRLHQDAATLRGLVTGVEADTATALKNTAAALDALATSGISDSAAVEAANTAVNALSTRLQVQCGVSIS